MLEPGYPIMPADLDAAVELAGVDLAAGDIMLVRTGQMVHLAPESGVTWWPTPGRRPG